MLDRRTVLAGGGVLASVALVGRGAASGVFGNLSQAQLDVAYDQANWAPNAVQVQQRYVTRSAAVAREMPPVTRRYGAGPHQFVDIFAPPGARGAPVFVIIHGGAWRLAMREAYYGPAPAIVAAGCVCVVVGFDCIPDVTIPTMARQIQRALGWITHRIGEWGGDGANLHLIGHSSGAHLAGVMATSADPLGLRGATMVSGIYDLYPVMLSSRRSFVHLTPREVATLSPMRHLDRLEARGIVAWGSKESPEFKRQSWVFAEALRGMGKLDLMLEADGLNHFEMFEQLYDARTPLMKAVLAQV